jgi:hypothetical protein
MTATISSAIFTASSKYFLFLKLGGWKDDVEILRSITMGSGGLSAPITTPNKRSPHPEASIKIVFPEKKQSNAKRNYPQIMKYCVVVFIDNACRQQIKNII